MANEESWEILIRMPNGTYTRTPKIFNRREAIATAYGMLNHSDVAEIQGRTSMGYEVIDLSTIRKEGQP